MALNTDRLKSKLKAAYSELKNAEVQSDEGLEILCKEIATSIVEEIRELSITYVSGLSSPSGPVTGSFTCNIN